MSTSGHVPDGTDLLTRELREEVGPFGTLLMTAHDCKDKAPMHKSMELLATKVMPAVNAALKAQA